MVPSLLNQITFGCVSSRRKTHIKSNETCCLLLFYTQTESKESDSITSIFETGLNGAL